MSVSSDYQVGIAACLDAITQAFNDGGAIIEKIKRKRALKRAPPPPRLLEESIDQAPSEIEREKQRGLNRFGKAFEDGDHIAVISLQQICIQLQQSLLEKLRNAAFDDDEKITDFTYLVDSADTGRDKTIAVLHEFKQRLLNADQPQDEEQHLHVQQRERKGSTPSSSTSNVASIAHEPVARAYTHQSTSSTGSQKQAQTFYTAPSKHRTWSRDFSISKEHGHSRDASGEEDAFSGADNEHNSHHRKRFSIQNLLKHTRTHSTSDQKDHKDKANNFLQQPIAEEPHRHLPQPPTSMPSRPAPTSEDAQSQPTKFRYEEWEDNPEEIWGTGTARSGSHASHNHLERRDTAVAPDQPSERRDTVIAATPLHPPSPVLTHRTNSNQSHHHMASTAVPTPNPENEFLGFCKGAWKLQNGDRKTSFSKCKEVDPWSRHPSAHALAQNFLSCQQNRCAFRSSFTHSQVDQIWNKVFSFPSKSLKLRWTFLAKSHVPQKVVVKHQYSFLCLFCVFTTGKSASHHGMEYYLDHIDKEHRGRGMSEVVLYKTGCIFGREAEDSEEFDINLLPKEGGVEEKKGAESSGEDLMDPYGVYGDGGGKSDSLFGSEPWNEGLSDFHYHGDLDRLSERI